MFLPCWLVGFRCFSDIILTLLGLHLKSVLHVLTLASSSSFALKSRYFSFSFCACRFPRCCDPSWTWCWCGSRRSEPRPRSSCSTLSSRCPDPHPASCPSWDTIATAELPGPGKKWRQKEKKNQTCPPLKKHLKTHTSHTPPEWLCPHPARTVVRH